MTILVRLTLWLLWAAALGWLRLEGLLGGVGAIAALLLGTLLAAWRFEPPRRRRSALRYVQMTKQPVA